jgi:hypothetical protein
MKLSRIAERLSLEPIVEGSNAGAEVTGGYCGDLLSHVLSSARPGDLWITIQHHTNVVAVAQVAGLSAIVIADGRQPDEATLSRAREGGIALYSSRESTFEIAGRLHRLLSDPT